MFQNDWERDAWLMGDVYLRDYQEAEIEADKRRTASLAISNYILAICERIGPDALTSALGTSPPETDAEARLNCLADRLNIFAPPSMGEDRLSLEALARELRAMAKGDKPQITEPAPFHGLKAPNAIRIAHHKLRALQWDAFLKSRGNRPADRHNAIASAYGEDWTTIYRWKPQVAAALGVTELDVGLDLASCTITPKNLVFPYETTAQAMSALEADGCAYRDERKRQFQVVEDTDRRAG